MPSIPLRTFAAAAFLVMGLVLVPWLGTLFHLTQANEEPTIEPEAQQALPEAEFVEPAPEREEDAQDPDLPPEIALPEPVEYQSEPVQSASVEDARPTESTADYREASQLSAAVEKDAMLERLSKEETGKLEQERPLSREQLPESERLDFSELVAVGESLKEDGVKSPAYKAKMVPEVIDGLRRNGFARLAVTADKCHYLFRGSLSEPGEPIYGNRKSDWRGWSMRGMRLDSIAGKELLRIGRGKIHGARTRCYAVMNLRDDIDSMVLGAQERAAASEGLSLEKIKCTSGEFITYKGMPFNYSINEMTDSTGRKILVAGKGPRKIKRK